MTVKVMIIGDVVGNGSQAICIGLQRRHAGIQRRGDRHGHAFLLRQSLMQQLTRGVLTAR